MSKKRLSKWYFKNEKSVMSKLGFKPQPGSGNNWLAKEDGENEFFLAQLKSTDSNSYRISRDDIDKLEYHAMVSHKIPVFIVQFLSDDNIYISLNAKDIDDFITYWKGDNETLKGHSEVLEMVENTTPINKKIIKSNGRDKYNKIIAKEKEKFYKDRKKR